MAILDDLNEHQKEAVLSKNGPILIIAGAGSGKTKTIAHRIANLISEGTSPDAILAVTFTNKAADEMKERVFALLGREGLSVLGGSMPFMGTFHSLGVFILRSYGHIIGIPKTFSILDEEDSRQLMRDIVKEFDLDPDSYPPPRVRSTISRLKNELVDIRSFTQGADESPYQKNIANIYAAYEARLYKSKSLDFDDLLLKTVLLLETSDEARAYYETRWEYIHIDEYQDTNRAQYAISRVLAHKHGNITVVGDVDQAIYSWRGADWRNILQFEDDWPGTKVILLEENYRSTQMILEAANAVISHNKERKEKNLWSKKEGGNRIRLMIFPDERQEASFITQYVEYVKSEGVPSQEIAILFRTNAQSRAIEESFLKKKIPYRLFAGVKFYERKEIKDVLAYLRLATNEDDIISKKRIVNTPVRGIGKALMVKYIGGAEIPKKDIEKIKKFEGVMATVRQRIATHKASRALKAVLKDAGFENYYKDNELEKDRWENIEELLSLATKFDSEDPPEGIVKLLTEASLMTRDSEIENKEEEVTLLTAHAAKGLEFRCVIIAGMEEGLFPHSLSESLSEMEEERRLFYVALTRAKESIVITLARRRMIYGDISYNDPSRFLFELPEHTLEQSLENFGYEESNTASF